jgi:hypothetical protein
MAITSPSLASIRVVMRKKVSTIWSRSSLTRFARSIGLPPGVQADRLSAEYTDGVLEVSAPLSESALPKQKEKLNRQANRKADHQARQRAPVFNEE